MRHSTNYLVQCATYTKTMCKTHKTTAELTDPHSFTVCLCYVLYVGGKGHRDGHTPFL